MENVLKGQEGQAMEKGNIPQELGKVIGPVIASADLSNEQKVEQVVKMVAVSMESFSGPMPHPDILRGYKDLIPDAPERILRMAEQEQQHRIEVENKMLYQNGENITEAAKANKRSQVFAFILTFLLVVAGVVLTTMDFIAVGITIFSTTILAVVSVFITGKVIKLPKQQETK